MSTSYLSDEQISQLLKGINPARVQSRDGMAHLEAYDVRAMLIRIFGFGRFDAGLTGDPVMLFETIGTKSNSKGETWEVVSVGYRATFRLTVKAPDGTLLASYTEAATGDAINFPINKRADAHDFAIKTAESQALKRCATNLGDQFGLSLYRKGSTQPLIMRTLIGGSIAPSAEPVDEGTPEITPEHGTPDPDMHPVPVDTTVLSAPLPDDAGSATPPPDEQDSPPADTGVSVGELREQVIAALGLRNRREAAKVLTRLQITASKQRLMEQPTHTPLGEPCTVRVLLDESIKLLARGDAA